MSHDDHTVQLIKFEGAMAAKTKTKWCSQNLCSPFLWDVKLFTLHYAAPTRSVMWNRYKDLKHIMHTTVQLGVSLSGPHLVELLDEMSVCCQSSVCTCAVNLLRSYCACSCVMLIQKRLTRGEDMDPEWPTSSMALILVLLPESKFLCWSHAASVLAHVSPGICVVCVTQIKYFIHSLIFCSLQSQSHLDAVMCMQLCFYVY